MRLGLRALLVVVVAAVATGSGAAAHSSTPLVTVPESIVFWNAHDGLLATAQCRRPGLKPCKTGAIERTSDGGRTYHVVLRTPWIFSLQTVGAFGAIAYTSPGETWRTVDGGRIWQRIPSKPTAYWLDARIGVRFHGYTAHNRGGLAMRVTHDGGRTWQRRRTPCARPDVAFNAVADLVTARLWWVACLGEGGAGNEDKAIYRTRDGGRTWEARAATDFIASRERTHGGISSYGYPAGLAFAPDGWGILTETRGTLYVSRDGGAHFRAEPHVARPENDFAGGAAAFRGGLGYVLLTHDFRGRLLETHDFGRTWQVVRRWRNG